MNIPFIDEDCTKDDDDFGDIKYDVIEVRVTGDGSNASM